jgi:hypothetical protein
MTFLVLQYHILSLRGRAVSEVTVERAGTWGRLGTGVRFPIGASCEVGKGRPWILGFGSARSYHVGSRRCGFCCTDVGSAEVGYLSHGISGWVLKAFLFFFVRLLCASYYTFYLTEALE